MTNASQLWDVCAQSIREQVSDGVWNSTFQEARPHGMIDHELVLTVPSLWVKERIEGRYNQLVLEALAEASSAPVQMIIEVETDGHDVDIDLTALDDPFASDDVRADGFCDCLFMLGRYEDMLNIYRRWQGELPAFLLLVQSAAQSQLRDIEGARASVREFESRRAPKPDPKVFVACHTRMMQREEDRARWLEAYREAGLPV